MASSTFTWGGSTGSFKPGTSWVGGVPPGSQAGDVILFDGSNTLTATVDQLPGVNPEQLIVTNPNAILQWGKSEDYEVTGTGAAPSSAGLDLSAGTLNIVSPDSTYAILGMNTGLITGGQVNIGASGEMDIENHGTLTLTSTGSISLTAGELDVGFQTANVGGGSEGSGVVYVTGGELLVTGGHISGLAFLQDNVNGSSVFDQTAGTLAASGKASFTAGAGTVSGGLFQAGTVSIGINFAINGGTVQATSGGGVTIAATDTVTLQTGVLDGTMGGVHDSSSSEIIGQGVIDGTIVGTGSVLASGGILDITASQSGDAFAIDKIAGSEAKFDGSSVTGGTVTFNANTIGVLGFGNGTALGHFTDSVANLGIASTPTSVALDNFINVDSSVTIGDIKVVGGTGNMFNTGDTQFVLYTDMTDIHAVGTITLASAPAAGTFVDWGADSSVNGTGPLGGIDVFLANMVCYAAGTLIRTDRGDVAVEDLAAGDMVVTLRNGQEVSMPIQWMGVRQVDIARHPQPHFAAPVRIRAGAFGDDLPRRDLLVSPAHAIFVDGKLVPANLLINNMTITQETGVASITYHHIELEQHAIILAEGLPAESYLDVGNRAFFSNAGLATVLHPEFHANAGLAVWAEKGCAPLAMDVEDVAPIWRSLAERAESLGYVPPRFTTTHDADLYVEANGRRLRPVAVAKGKYTFLLPAGASDIVLHSRTSAPGDLDPLTGDWRALGVAVRSMTVRSGDEQMVIPADHPALSQGWHTPEAGNGGIWRWTNGAAAIPMVNNAGPAMLDIEVAEMGTYILARSDRDEQRLAA